MATQVAKHFSLIFENQKFNTRIMENLNDENSPLAVVSIIGAQSSGKSTLLNHMFGTKFEEMDAKSGRHRTTKGIRVAKISWNRRCILVIDTEGSDGKERKGNETFARQTAVFAMAISRVVIINMMCTDIGRESGGGWPLLRTACEGVQRIKPPRQVKLLFVLRDKTDSPLESPLEALKRQITDEMEKIWKEMTGTRAQGNARLSKFFEIEVTATSSYLTKRRNFIAEVEKLKGQIIKHATSNESTSDSVPTSTFTTYARKIWVQVKTNKDLDLPGFRIMATKELCDRIAKKQCDSFHKEKSWLQIKKNMEKTDSIVQGFGNDVSKLISTHLSRYDRLTIKFDKTTRDERGKRLITELLRIIEPIYLCLVERMRSKTLKGFRNAALDQLKKDGTLKGVEVQAFIDQFNHQVKDAYITQAKWTHASRQRGTLRSDINAIKKAIEETNAQLDRQQMMNKKGTWKQIATCILQIITGTSVVAASALANPLALAGLPAAIIPSASKLLEVLLT